jgi:hypothetical protein
MRPLDLQLTHEQRAVRSVIGQADRPLQPPAATEAGAVVPQE